MEILEYVMTYIQPVIDFFMPGLVAYAGDSATGSVNWMALGIQLGVIALVLALLMREMGAILIFTVVGIILHVIVDVVMPIVRGGAEFDMDLLMTQFTDVTYYLYLGALAIGYFLALILLSIIKGLFFRGD
ncbi:hypothetical protein [Maricaulis sp. CAU 1757]